MISPFNNYSCLYSSQNLVATAAFTLKLAFYESSYLTSVRIYWCPYVTDLSTVTTTCAIAMSFSLEIQDQDSSIILENADHNLCYLSLANGLRCLRWDLKVSASKQLVSIVMTHLRWSLRGGLRRELQSSRSQTKGKRDSRVMTFKSHLRQCKR